MSNPYVYRLDHLETKQFYIGYREANTLPALEDLPIYKTSSVKVRELGFESFSWKILAEFETGIEAWDYEQKIISECINDPLCLNKHFHLNGNRRYRFVGPHSEKTRNQMSETKFSMKKLLSNQAKRLWSKEEYRQKHDNLSYTRTDSAKLKMSESKKKFFEDPINRKACSEKFKNLWKTEEYRTKNDLSYLRTDEVKKKISETVSKKLKTLICPHCGREGKGPWMYQKHFDRCKLKEDKR
jgi:hypothetical protein